MSNIAIKVEKISKLYRLGEIGMGTISHDLTRWWYKTRGKGDPYAKLGEENKRDEIGNSEWVWAVKNISFDVFKGEVLGIIGKNGAGKSTLLKLLSRVTAPTTGIIKAKGRIASLLEVGTGFHPDLTGRENIFLNGAILGMKKNEIKSKFDEIVQFAGIERYVDTPVKRYSSGMYVRLAFAVAAHLEPEILIVDEVLAVGDAEFQKKCLGKMKDVSVKEGRTVLFVSHNMAAVKSLCTSGLVLQNGTVVYSGNQLDAVNYYQSNHNTNSCFEHTGAVDEAPGNEKIRVSKFFVESLKDDVISISSGLRFELFFYNYRENINLDVTFELISADEVTVFHRGEVVTKNRDSKIGLYHITGSLAGNILNSGSYRLKVIFGENQRYPIFIADDLVRFEILNESKGSNSFQLPGVLSTNIDFAVKFESQL